MNPPSVSSPSSSSLSLPAARPELQLDRTRELRERAHQIIPGGAHTYAKGDDQYPVLAPGFIERGLGAHVWDVDGNEYIEYGMGLRAVGLGHAYPSVIEAAHREMLRGANFTRPSPIEVECAAELLKLVPTMDMVKFAKNGSDATTAALKLARAYTGRPRVAICGDHPFFSTDDWFIGATPMSAGIPSAIQELTLKFRYNDIESVRQLFAAYPNQIACVFLEPATATEPREGFLEQLRALCTAEGALLVFDEMITGFRWCVGGAHTMYGVTPDLATFGKAIGNGFAVAALTGKAHIMERGGLNHDKERVFLLSTTHGAETHGLAAALETMRVYQREPVIETMYARGTQLREGAHEAARRHGVEAQFQVLGRPCNMVYATRDASGAPSQLFRALFLQEIIARGVIAPSFVVSYAHTEADIDRTIDAVDAALEVYRRALDDGVEAYLVGRPVKPVFRPYN